LFAFSVSKLFKSFCSKCLAFKEKKSTPPFVNVWQSLATLLSKQKPLDQVFGGDLRTGGQERKKKKWFVGSNLRSAGNRDSAGNLVSAGAGFGGVGKMNENFEDVIVPGQGIRRVSILDLQVAIGFSGWAPHTYICILFCICILYVSYPI
jgi:hypothetical protein